MKKQAYEGADVLKSNIINIYAIYAKFLVQNSAGAGITAV